MKAIKRLPIQPETWLLFSALFLLACSSGWVGWRWVTADPDPSHGGRGLLHDAVTAPSSVDAIPAVSDAPAGDRIWKAPQPQADGPEWVYELFTPPAIYRRLETNEFLASLPAAKNPAPEQRHPDFDLLEVRPALFRLQLVGFAGEAGNLFGLFEDMVTTEHFLAGTDAVIPALGLKIERLRVIRGQDRNSDETAATAGLVAEAVVRDEASGEEIRLTDRERIYHGEPSAIICVHGAPDERFTLRRNEEIEHDGVRYRARDIHLAPPVVDLIAALPGETDSEAWTLSAASDSGS